MSVSHYRVCPPSMHQDVCELQIASSVATCRAMLVRLSTFQHYYCCILLAAVVVGVLISFVLVFAKW